MSFDVGLLHATFEVAARSVTVSVAGELDLESSDAFTREVLLRLPEGCTRIDLDVERVAFCDSCGIRALARLAAAAKDLGAELRLRHVPDRLYRLLAATNLVAYFDLDRAPAVEIAAVIEREVALPPAV